MHLWLKQSETFSLFLIAYLYTQGRIHKKWGQCNLLKLGERAPGVPPLNPPLIHVHINTCTMQSSANWKKYKQNKETLWDQGWESLSYLICLYNLNSTCINMIIHVYYKTAWWDDNVKKKIILDNKKKPYPVLWVDGLVGQSGIFIFLIFFLGANDKIQNLNTKQKYFFLKCLKFGSVKCFYPIIKLLGHLGM